MCSHQKMHTWCGDTQLGGVSQIQSLSLEAKGWCPTSGTPSPSLGTCAGEMSPKHLALETNRAKIREIQSTAGNRDDSLKGLTCRLTPRPHIKCSLKNI